MLYFSIQNARGGAKSNLGCEAVSWSDPARIGPALEMTFQLFSRNLSEILESHFAWQAQYLVSLDNDTCCSAHCK